MFRGGGTRRTDGCANRLGARSLVIPRRRCCAAGLGVHDCPTRRKIIRFCAFPERGAQLDSIAPLIGQVFYQLLDPASEMGAKFIEYVSSRVVVRMIR